MTPEIQQSTARKQRILRVGIMPRELYQARIIAIAKGEYKPGRKEPKVWFHSLQALAQVLSQKNLELLTIIVEQSPQSVTDLAERSGREKSNLSRTLRTLAHYRFISLEKEARRLRPVAHYDRIEVQVPVH